MISSEGIAEGSHAVIEIPAPWGRMRWLAQHFNVRVGQEFSDRQLRGPFHRWQHRHLFERQTDSTCVLRDEISYELPLSPLSDIFAGWFVRRALARMFFYRHQTVQRDLEFWRQQSQSNHRSAHSAKDHKPMRILITGSSGLIGSALMDFLSMGGHQVMGVSRAARRDRPTVVWDLNQAQPVDASLLMDGQPLDAVIHLAGEGIADHRWSVQQKDRLVRSRVDATANLISGLSALGLKPRLFMSASGVGIYGNAGDDLLTERASHGQGFLAELAQQWEEASRRAEKIFSARCVQLRMSTVLSARGGALARMLLPFQWGLGGPLGRGQQWMSWVALDDVLYAIAFLLNAESVSGPVNLVSPEPVRNSDFTKTLAGVLGRPALLPAPRFALRLALGEMADELLLCSQRAVPQALIEAGFQFRCAHLEDALRQTLGRPATVG
jgi:uncharacterized protein (TIGR01777 family)